MRWPVASTAIANMHTAKHVHLSFLILFSTLAVASMPYNPTRILQNGTLLYVLQPSERSPTQFQLASFDVSSSVAASDIAYTTLYSSLPFQPPNNPQPFTPVLHSGGQMTVYTGICADGASGGQVWNFVPMGSSPAGNGTWEKKELVFDKDSEHVADMGANYLTGAVAFNTVVDGTAEDSKAYIFGGMCPAQEETQDWQSNAEYSNSMVILNPSSTGEDLRYRAEMSFSRGPPISEAGFTLTGLAPSYSNRSDGTQTQQQNFVLLGGHTSAAFINMSQVALFSLPQQGWTFVPVLQPDQERTDLAVRRDVNEVEPRSGHTAVLTPDGQRLVVFGGWIGDIDTPAEPQLAILNVGEGYGGTADWEWTVPSTSGHGLPPGSGLYGHGAAMLPGGVMMVTGGFSIPQPTSHRRRAEPDPVLNTKTYFFNVTSHMFVTEYVPPKVVSMKPSHSGPLATSSQKAGLGIGLGIGMAAVLTLLVFYLWYTRRLKRQREYREKQLEDLSLGAHRYTLDCMSPGIDGRGGYAAAVDYYDDPNDSYFDPTAEQQNNKGWRQAHGQEAERTGLLVEIPSPTRGLRRSLSGRANHHMSRYDERRVQGSGHIHPIDELEEEQEQHQEGAQMQATINATTANQPMMSERPKRAATIFDSAPVLDPFVDKEQRDLPSHSASTSPGEDQHHDRNEWLIGSGASLPRQASLRSNGRYSPDRSDRTESMLSEHSTRSNPSSAGSIGRSVSFRSTGLPSNPFKTPGTSPTGTRPNRLAEGGCDGQGARTESLTSHSSRLATAAEEGDLFTTARTSFMQLQAEGEALLGGNLDRARPGTSSTSNGSSGRSHPDTEPSISRAATVARFGAEDHAQSKRRRWLGSLGSVRKALGRSSATDGRTRSLTTTAALQEPYTDNPQPSPYATKNDRKSFPSTVPPRRAASDAGYFRGRRGKQDWLDDELDPNDPVSIWRRNSGDDWGAPEDVILAERERQKRAWRERSSTLINISGNDSSTDLPTPRTPIHPRDLGDAGRANSLPTEEEDWDVEAAVERRVVQVMFTVPKSKLRVVNADIDRSSILSLPRDKEMSDDSNGSPGPSSGSPNRVKDLVGRFEQSPSPRLSPLPSSPRTSLGLSPRLSPAPSPAPSIRSLKLRADRSESNLRKELGVEGRGRSSSMRVYSEDITSMREVQ